MGINNPSEISRYTLREEDNKDALRIYYKRAKGSLLPESKTFRLGRVLKKIITDSGAPKYAEGGEMSPILRAAVRELDGIVKQSADAAEQKKAIIDEIDHLERDLSSRINDLRARIEQL